MSLQPIRMDRQTQEPPPRLSPGRRVFWTLVGALGVLAFSATFWIVAPASLGLMDPGFTTVRVHEKTEGLHLYIPVPSFLLQGSVSAAAAGGAFEQALRQTGPLPPQATLALAQAGEMVDVLAAADDFTLVEVEDGSDHVLVAKQGRRLVVRVRSPDVDVDVSVPIVLVRGVLRTVVRATENPPRPTGPEAPEVPEVPEPWQSL